MLKLFTDSVDETRDAGAALAAHLRAGDLVVLSGRLGSGKTALVQGIGRGLGVPDPVVSPSFIIVREYEGRVPLVHVDVYRLDHFQELHDLGFEEVLDSGGVTVIEWGDRVAPALPGERLEIHLEAAGEDRREIVCEARGSSWHARLEDLRAALAAWAGD